MKMTDEAMTEMVTRLRNKTQLARFTAGECVDVFRTMEDNGYSIGMKKPEPAPEPKVARKHK